MAHDGPPSNDRKRVKVYELKNNDWHDRGTGFCMGTLNGPGDARILVESEEDPSRILLETRIAKDDGYQKQQDTLIVWTEPTGVDMALSFQEPEGCTAIWEYVYEVQQRLMVVGPDDLDDDMLDANGAIMLPSPELGNLHEIETAMRQHSMSSPGRDALIKFIMAPEHLYVTKLVPLVEMAEDLEDLPGLHHLCTIMKTLILLNDTAIVEFIVRDDLILGVVGALEYDSDFPSHKANHRQFLANNSKFKEVVRIESPDIRRKIHLVYRLHYLKDVVLARILDDPTFSVLNSLIYFHQVDIVNHLHSDASVAHELFAIFDAANQDSERKKDAVLFIQHLCAIAKNVQAQHRSALYSNWINTGLFDVITYALTNTDPAVRVAGSDILVALIDHDPGMMRIFIVKSINEERESLTDTLVDLLLVEQDLGIKTQIADAIKVLLDPTSNSTSIDMLGRTNGEFLAKMRPNIVAAPPQVEQFIETFYEESAPKLFMPLITLRAREDVSSITVTEASLYEHLVGILCFFMRLHSVGRQFVIARGLWRCVDKLLACPYKYLKLAAVRLLRTLISLGDASLLEVVLTNRLYLPLLDLVERTRRRDNLVQSACLELFEYLKNGGPKALVTDLVGEHRERLTALDHVDTFEGLINKFDGWRWGNPMNAEESFSTQGTAGTPNRVLVNGGQRWNAGIKETDADEEAYFATSDDEEEGDVAPPQATAKVPSDGVPARPLVSYPDEDDESDMIPTLPSTGEGSDAGAKVQAPADATQETPPRPRKSSVQAQLKQQAASVTDSPDPIQSSPSERPSEKRRREEDEEDSLNSMASNASKRRNSSGSAMHTASQRNRRKSKSPSPTAPGTPSPAPTAATGNPHKATGSGNSSPSHGPNSTTTPTSTPTGKENGPTLRRKGSLRQNTHGRESPHGGRNGGMASGMHISVKSGGGDKSSGTSD